LLSCGPQTKPAGDRNDKPATPAGQSEGDTVHRIPVIHPAFESKTPKVMSLSQRKDERGFPVEYHMLVDSVVCPGKVCDVVQVRIYWDALGNYSRLELPKGVNLTKQGHKIFTKGEYQKLDQILADRASLLRDYPFRSITRPSAKLKADAVSGATKLSLRRAVVSGAGYTCFHLWHWVNGSVVSEARKLTHA